MWIELGGCINTWIKKNIKIPTRHIPYVFQHIIDVHQSAHTKFQPHQSSLNQNNAQVLCLNFGHLATSYTSWFSTSISSHCIRSLIIPYIHYPPQFTFVPCFINFHYLVSLTLHPKPELQDPHQSLIPRPSGI